MGDLLIESLMWGAWSANTNHFILTKMFGLEVFVNIIISQYWHILCIYASLDFIPKFDFKVSYVY
jgi:hypothetical protein